MGYSNYLLDNNPLAAAMSVSSPPVGGMPLLQA